MGASLCGPPIMRGSSCVPALPSSSPSIVSGVTDSTWANTNGANDMLATTTAASIVLLIIMFPLCNKMVSLRGITCFRHVHKGGARVVSGIASSNRAVVPAVIWTWRICSTSQCTRSHGDRPYASPRSGPVRGRNSRSPRQRPNASAAQAIRWTRGLGPSGPCGRSRYRLLPQR